MVKTSPSFCSQRKRGCKRGDSKDPNENSTEENIRKYVIC
jgi:hypothetical protein